MQNDNCVICGCPGAIEGCIKCGEFICKECKKNKYEGFCYLCNEEKEFWFDYFIKKLGKVILGGKQ